MKRLIGLVAAGITLLTAAFSHAEIATPSPSVLTSFDFNIVGVGLKASPDYQAVPKGIASKVITSFDASGFDVADIIAQLPADYTVRAELSGPAFQTPVALVTKPGQPFDLPTLAVIGTYTLANIRLCDGAGTTLFGAVPQAVAVESIPDPLVTSVTTRQLTLQELQDRGVTFDTSNFSAYEFTAGIATEGGQVPITLPVIIPTSATVVNPEQLPTAGAPTLTPPPVNYTPPGVPPTSVPQNLAVSPFMFQVDEKEVAETYSIPPIPGVVVIPGNIGFLHQYFSALALVTNGAPQQSNLVIRDVRAKIIFPAGEDLTAGTDEAPGDDPLRMARGASGYFPRIMGVMNAGPDGRVGTSDDVGSLRASESGQADFTIEGLKEGTHKLDFEITAVLDGLPIGPVTLTGKATGAVLVRNPSFAMTFGHPSTVRSGEAYDLFITITNTGRTVANQLIVHLDPRAVSGAAFAPGEASDKGIDTIQPGSSATVRYRLVSQRTGRVTATAFESEDVAGRFILRTGVGENGIPLSPDSLILPYTGTLPDDLVNAAVGLLGQAWSVATAPAGALPASVLPIDKQTISNRAYDLSEAGLRVLIGDSLVRAAEELAFDFMGSDETHTGFDSLRRSSTQGELLNGALASVFADELTRVDALAFQRSLADQVSYRTGHISAVTTPAAVRVTLTDAGGKRTGVLGDGSRAREIRYADQLLLAADSVERATLTLATKLEAAIYRLEVVAAAVADFDLGVVVPGAGGVLQQLSFAGVHLGAGGRGTVELVPGSSGSYTLAIDTDGDGTPETSLNASAAVIPDHGPRVVAARQIVPGFGPGGDKHGRNVALLFSERVTRESAQNVANYLVDENAVVSATLQPSRRMAFVLLRDGIGPFVTPPRSLTVSGLRDEKSNTMAAPNTLPIVITAQGPAALVSGTVRTAHGEPIAGATVRLLQQVWVEEDFQTVQKYAIFSEKTVGADGRYQFDYVLRNYDPAAPFMIEAIHPQTGEKGNLTTNVLTNGQRLTLDIFMKARGSVSGTVRDGAGAPAGGTAVQLTTLADSRTYVTTADAAGAFSFTGATVGAFSLKAVNAATRSQGTIMGTLPDEGGSVVQDVTIYPLGSVAAGTLSGKVLDADGTTPRAGVIVIVEKDNYRNWQRSAADGSYAFTGVYAGGVTVTARDDATGEITRVTTAVLDKETTALNIILKGTGTVRGTVQRGDGKSVAGLYVIAAVNQIQRVVQTDASGAFVFAGLPMGTINIQVLDPLDFNRTIATGTVSLLTAGETVNVPLYVPEKALATGSIQGTVYRRDGTVVPFAEVHRLVEGQLAYYAHKADAAGNFTIPDLPLGTYRLVVQNGNEVANATATLWYDTQTRTVDMHPVGIGTVTVTTYDDAGKTLPTGADVTFVSTKPNEVGWLVYESRFPAVVKTDPQTGKYTFTGAYAGGFTVTSSNIFRPTPVTVAGSVTSDRQTVTVDLSLKGSVAPDGGGTVNLMGSIFGQVLMPDGSAAGEGVRVTVNFGGADVTVTTDSTGKFQFSPIIPSGNKTLRAETPADSPFGVLKWQGYVYVPAGLDVPVTIKLLGRGSLTVTVRDAGGAPAAGANVKVQGVSYPNDGGELVTGADGSITLVNLSEGNYAVSARDNLGHGGTAQANIPADKAAASVEVRLSPSATVTGHFFKADGRTPVAGGQIKLIRNGQVAAYATTSTDVGDPGRFTMTNIPLGDFTLEGFDPVTERHGGGGGRLVTNAETATADVIVTPQGTVKGTILNYGGTAPVAGASVTITVTGVAGYRYTTITGPDGAFVFAGVPAGRFTISATDPTNGLRGQTSGSLSYEDETVTVQVRIAPTGAIEGRVFMPDGTTVATGVLVSLDGGAGLPTDAATGGFRFENLAAGRSYTLAARQSGTLRTGSAIATINSDGETANGDIVLRGIGMVAGVVYDTDGVTPLFGAHVRLFFSGLQDDRYTDENGSYSFTGIPAGAFTLQASHQQRTTAASASGILRNEGETVTVNMTIGPVASVTGTVLLADGVTPARGAGVRFKGCDRVLTGVTDTNGVFSFTAIPVPCSFTLDMEDAAVLGIGRYSGSLATNGETMNIGTIVLDDKPITVASTQPADGAVGVAVDGKITVLFSEQADPATVNSGTVYLTRGGNRVNGTLTLEAGNTAVSFRPANLLAGQALYTLVVTTGVKDLVGRPLPGDVSVTFTTIDNVAPAVQSISPENGSVQVAGDAVVRITFSEPVNPATLGAVKLLRGGTAVATRLDLIQGGTVAALTPLAGLDLNATYTVSVTGVRDLANNAIQGTVTTFATLDTIIPTITALTVSPTADIIKGNSVPVTAQVADNDVALVDFYVDDVYKATARSVPFTAALVLSKEGSLHVKAIAQDKVGNRGIAAPLDLNVAADQPPQVAILTPNDGIVAATGSTITVTVQVTDDLLAREITLIAAGEVSSVQTVTNPAGTGKSFTASFTLAVPTDITHGGTIQLTAVAKDSVGSASLVALHTITVADTIAPVAVSLASPGQTTPYKPGDTGSATFTFTDNVGVTSVACTASGAATGSQSFAISPAQKQVTQTSTFQVAANAASNAGLTVSCTGSDVAGNQAVKTVNLNVADFVAPTVAITAPAEGTVVGTGATVNVTLQVTDDVAVKEVTLTATGEVNSVQTRTNASGTNYTTSFTLTMPADITRGGGVQLTATAKDAAGNPSTQTVRNLTVHDSTAPTAVSLTSPGQTTLYKPGDTGTVTFVASDNVGVTSITCTSSGAATGSQSFTINPAQKQVTQAFSFQVAAGAAPYAPMGITCTAFDAAANQTAKSLSLTVADIVAPTVTGASVANNATDVPVNAGVTVNFSETLLAATVSNASVVMTDGTGTAVAGAATLASDRRSITFMPQVLLARGASYTLTVTTGVTDDAGNALAAPYTLNFTTDNSAASIVSVTPTGSNVPVGTAVGIIFSEPLDATSVTVDTFVLASSFGAVSGAVNLSSKTVTFKPYSQLSFNRDYTLTVKSGVKDISGNATVTDNQFTFRTQSPSSDLVGLWTMDGDWSDSSGNGHHGTASGGAAFSSASTDHIGGTAAGSFDGVNDYVELGNWFNLQTFSIEMWVNPGTTQVQYADIIDNNHTASRSWVLQQNSNSLNQYCWGSICFNLNANQWSHVTLTRDGSSKFNTLYVNGIPIGTQTGWNINYDGTQLLRLGRWGGGGRNWNGFLDEVAIYNRSLPPEDVLEHYNAGLSADRTPPSPPTIDPLPAMTGSSFVVLTGSKERGTSIRVNGKQVVPHDDSTKWQVLYPLAMGQNLLDVTSRDISGNATDPITVSVNYVPSTTVPGSDSTSLTSRMSVDNGYRIYVSASENVAGTEFGSGNNWGVTDTFSTKLIPNIVNYLHVYSYDQGGVAGLLGSLSLSDSKFKFSNGTQNLLSNTTDWRVYRDMFGGNSDTVTGYGSNGVSPWGTRPNIASNAVWIWTHDANGDDVAYFSTTVIPSGPSITITSPGQTTRYRPGETGVASITANFESGIQRVVCSATGGASGHLDESFEPPLNVVNGGISFQVVESAVPYESYNIICHAQSGAGVWSEKVLQLQAADVVPAVVSGASIANNATGVIATVPITVTFSEAMQPSSFTSDTVKLIRVDTGELVGGTIALSLDGKILTFTPTAALAGSTTYQFLIHGVDDLAGNGSDFAINFTTQAAVAVTITGQGCSTSPYVLASGRYSTVSISSSYVVFDGLVAADSLSLRNGSVLSHFGATSSTTAKLDIQATDIAVDSTSKIDVSDRGYLGGYSGGSTGNTSTTGSTNGTLTGSMSQSGGSYGGLGGALTNNAANQVYGDLTNPNEQGSGGGTDNGNNRGGNGGGLVRITVGALSLDGSIIADGGNGVGGYGSGGSGGGIRIDAGTVTGSGYIYARGGAGPNRGGGGGGRIAVYYGSMTLLQANIVATGGTGTKNGGAGTLYLKSNSDTTDQLLVDNRGVDTGEGSTPIPAIGSGVVTELTATSITTSGMNWKPGALKGMKFNPDVTQTRLFTVIDNDATTLRIDGAEGDLTQVAVRGSVFAGTYAFTKMTVVGKARVSCLDRFAIVTELLANDSTFVTNYIVADKVTVNNGGLLSHWQTTLSVPYQLEIKALTNVTIDSTSKIDVSDRGYLGGYSGGSTGNTSTTGRTNGTLAGSTSQSGGSYGGLGGALTNNTANQVYGDLTNPNEQGSGGGTDNGNNRGGNGGGLVRITVGALSLDGNIIADGGNGVGGYGSGGSGGGIRIDATTVSGGGYIYARGGAGPNRGGGGGGRIAIYYGSMTLPQANIGASGGTGYRNGGAGTLYLQQH